MDAKSKANFINSVAAGTAIPCPKCGTVNESDSRFCYSCGTELSVPQTPQVAAPAFEQIEEEETSAQVKEKEAFAQIKEKETSVQVKEKEAFAQVMEKEKTVQVSRYVEPKNVFAQGLPEWDIEPPQVMVRRR